MDKQRCEDIKIPMCRGIGYNLTKFPNSLNIETQDEAGLEVHQFYPLVEINCSEDLKFFLCSMYTPICIEDYHQPLPACRSVCERARKGCEPIMENYGFPWPEKMACENLPVHGDQSNLCMERPDAGEEQSKTETTSSNNKKHHGSSGTKKCPKGDRRCQQAMNANNELKGRGGDCACKCRHPLVPLSKESMWYNTTVAKVGSVSSCGIPCRGKFKPFVWDQTEFSISLHFIFSPHRSLLHTRREGFRQLLDSNVVGFLCSQHIHDTYDIPHRYRAFQVSRAANCVFVSVLLHGVDGLLDKAFHWTREGRMRWTSHQILVDWTELVHYRLLAGVLLWHGVEHLVGDIELHLVPLSRTQMGEFLIFLN